MKRSGFGWKKRRKFGVGWGKWGYYFQLFGPFFHPAFS
jgi:hypothetical protein